MTANEGQRRQWSHPGMVAGWEKRERLTERVSRHVLAAATLQPGEHVLEIGSGGGKLALLAATQVRASGRVLGADISPGMVDLATARAAAARAKNVSFVVADCQADELPGAPFDVAISQFGVMFFDDPVAAFANIRNQLKRGSRLAFACWQPPERNAWFPGPVFARFATEPRTVPDPGQRPAPGLFAFSEPGYVRGILQDAGFMGIDRVAKTVTVRAPLDSVIDAERTGQISPDPGQAEAVLAAVDAHFAPLRIPDSDLYRFELRIQVFTANASS